MKIRGSSFFLPKNEKVGRMG